MVAMYLTFSDLRPGDRFRFVYGLHGDRRSSHVFVKGKAGWYAYAQPVVRRSYRTGRTTAVARAK